MPELKFIEKYYKNICTNLQFIIKKNNVKTLAFFSASTSDGVTTTLINIAELMSFYDKKILLIEANINNPSFQKFFKIKNNNGLLDYFSKKIELNNIINKIAFEEHSLNVITSGDVNNKIKNFLTSQEWENVLLYAKNNYDIILLDLPSIISNTDTAFLASLCDGAILVIRAGKTRYEVIKHIQKTLSDANAKLLGTILNQREFKIPEFIYKRI